jgi:magnesium-transporting ATPase (P-type)
MKLAMITGDALVTACYVASTSGILTNVDKSDYEDNIQDSLDDILVLQLSKNGNSSKLQWVDLEGQIVFKYNESDDYDYDNGQEDGDKDGSGFNVKKLPGADKKDAKK